MPVPFTRPGVYVTEQLIGPAPTTPNTNPSVAGFIGEHWKGPVGKAVYCSNWAQFVQYYGGFITNYPGTNPPTLANPWLPFAVYEFFNQGGQQCWIQRIAAGASPGASSSATLLDQAATPQPTLSVSAGLYGLVGSPGTWGNSLFVDVVTNPAGAGQFNLLVYSGGYGPQFLVEQWLNLSMVPSNPRYALTIVNAVGTGSTYIVLTNLNSPSAAPTNAPAAVTQKQLLGGLDPGDPATADKQAAVTSPCPMDVVPNVLNLALPGETTVAVMTVAIAYAAARPSTFLVMDPPVGQSPAQAVTFAQSLGFGTGTAVSQAGLYYPWEVASNPSGNNAIATVTMPPSGFVLGQMAAIDNLQGPWFAPAGTQTALLGAVGTERALSPTDLGTLNVANVNAIRQMPNGAVIIWGARTMITAYATQYVPIRRTLNFIEAALVTVLNNFVFQPNDQVLWAQIVAACSSFLSGIAHQGAFAGSVTAQQYFVTCDSTNNTPNSIAAGITNVNVGVALVYPAEFINLTLSQFQNGGTSVVTANVP